MPTTARLYRRSELEASDCLHRYKAIWIDGVDDSSDYSLRGVGFHRVKHQYIQMLRESGLTHDEELSRKAFVVGVGLAKTPTHLLPELRQLWEFHAERWELPLDRFVAAEEKQQADGIGFAPDLVLAHPERNELEIVDDKTTFAPLTEVQAHQDFQARLYTRKAKAVWPGFSSYRFTFAWVRYGSLTSAVFTHEELDRIDLEITAALARIEQAKIDEAEGESNAWPAQAGPSCSFCTLECPLVDHPAVLPKRLEGLTQAQRAGALVLAGDRMLKTVRKALKAYCSAYGPLSINGVVFDNRPILERTYPVDVVLKVLQARSLGGAFEEHGLTLSHSALSKLLKRFPQLEEDLAPYEQTKTTYRFSAKKPGQEEHDEE